MPCCLRAFVTPLAGVWIETARHQSDQPSALSLPLRECGLKQKGQRIHGRKTPSLPLRECGLKPPVAVSIALNAPVTPLAGVWIETPSIRKRPPGRPRSLPLRECGLKPTPWPHRHPGNLVTPLAGVWIETDHALPSHILQIVTPLAGVWIETYSSGCSM